MATKSKKLSVFQRLVERADIVAIGTLFASIVLALFAWFTLSLDRRILEDNAHAALKTEQATIFMQFQQQYGTIRAAFPEGYSNPDFKPDIKSADFTRLEAYWILSFSEWYATHNVDRDGLNDLWTDYFAQAAAGGLLNKPLRYVLEARILSIHAPVNKNWAAYYRELAQLARDKNKQPLDTKVEDKIKHLQVYH